MITCSKFSPCPTVHAQLFLQPWDYDYENTYRLNSSLFYENTLNLVEVHAQKYIFLLTPGTVDST